MKIKVNDQVVVITGKDKGKKGKVMRTFSEKKQIIVERINMRIKHVKKTSTRPGEIIQFEAPIDVYNVMAICPKTDKKTRVGYKKSESGKKIRFAKVSGEPLDK